MKRLFCLICIILLSCRLTWAQAYGESEAGTQSSVTYTHETDCDSAHIDFGYDGDGGADSLNFYVTVDLLPCFSGDGTILTGEGLELDSIGGHLIKVTYFLSDGDAVADGYVGGLWLNKNPSSGDTIQRAASVFDPATDTVIWVDTVFYAGAAQKNTEGEITSWVKHTLEDTSNVARDATKNDYKDGTGGTGADTFDIYVFNGDTTAQEGIAITIYNEAHTAVAVPVVTTNVNGKVQIYLDADTYHLYLQRLGVIYTEWDTIVVSNQGIDTIWVAAYDIGSPPSANVTRVKGFTRTYGYQKTDRVTVSFSTHDRNLIDTTAGVFIDKIDEVTYSDTGFFQIDLIPSISLLSKQAGITKDSILYDVKIYAPGRSVFEWQNIFIPDTSGAVWLKDLLE